MHNDKIEKVKELAKIHAFDDYETQDIDVDKALKEFESLLDDLKETGELDEPLVRDILKSVFELSDDIDPSYTFGESYIVEELEKREAITIDMKKELLPGLSKSIVHSGFGIDPVFCNEATHGKDSFRKFLKDLIKAGKTDKALTKKIIQPVLNGLDSDKGLDYLEETSFVVAELIETGLLTNKEAQDIFGRILERSNLQDFFNKASIWEEAFAVAAASYTPEQAKEFFTGSPALNSLFELAQKAKELDMKVSDTKNTLKIEVQELNTN